MVMDGSYKLDILNDVDLIGFTGLIGSGKSKAAKIISNYFDYKEINFADEVKNKLCNMLDIGNWRDVFRNYDKSDHILLDYRKSINKFEKYPVTETLRTLLQEFGTDFVRKNISYDFWIVQVQNRIIMDAYYNKDKKYVISDVRFDNEAMWIRQNGGFIISIKSNNSIGSDHESEEGIDAHFIDHEIINNYNIFNMGKESDDEFRDKVLLAYKKFKG